MCWTAYVTSTKKNEQGWYDTLFSATSGNQDRAIRYAKEFVSEKGLKDGEYTIECEDTTDKYE